MTDKPTVDVPNWATSHTISDSDTTARAYEPSAAKKAEGWELEEVPPSNIFNYLAKAAALWIAWLVFYAETHVHDGGAGDESAPKVHIADHIDYGESGNITIQQDTPTDTHYLRHQGLSGAVAVFESSALLANSHLSTSQIRPDFLEGSGVVKVQGATGVIAEGKAEIHELRVKEVRARTGTNIEFKDSAGADNAFLIARQFTASDEVAGTNGAFTTVESEQFTSHRIPFISGRIDHDGGGDASATDGRILAPGYTTGVYTFAVEGDPAVDDVFVQATAVRNNDFADLTHIDIEVRKPSTTTLVDVHLRGITAGETPPSVFVTVNVA